MIKAGVKKKLDEVWRKQKHRTEFWDKSGAPLTLSQWCELFEDSRYCQIVFNIVEEGVTVSTVWIGMNPHRRNPPLIFETMITGPGLRGRNFWSWATEEEARAGHQRILDGLKQQIGQPVSEESHQ